MSYPDFHHFLDAWSLKDGDDDSEERAGSEANKPTDDTESKQLVQTAVHPLCARCSRLSFDKIFRVNTIEEAELPGYYRNLNYLNNWHKFNSLSCPLCNLMLFAIDLEEDSRSPMLFWSPSKVFQKYQPFSLITTVYFNPCYEMPRPPFIVSSRAKGLDFIRLLKADSIDFRTLSGWLEFCNKNHIGCKQRTESTNVDGLRFIDCETRSVVPASDHPYVSLSYVWGPQPEGASVNKFIEVLPDHLPATIEDSISVTKALGYRYLWIDRYCLDRRGEQQFMAQLQQMGMIYKKSNLTIVAASGTNDKYGLPGVNHRKRRPQLSTKVDDHLLVSSMSDATALIDKSVWKTRGWTFQEGCLSTRRLFFTDEQVYYECQGSFHSEVLDYDIQDQHDRGVFKFWEGGMGISLPSPEQINDKTWRKTLDAIWDHIYEYTRRELGQPLDILNAFRGVLGAFENMVPPYRHLLGIPVPPSPPDSLYESHSSPFHTSDEIPVQYRTSTEAGFVGALCWELEGPSSRRHGFPSWSWMGWHGRVKHPGLNLGSLARYYLFRDVVVEIELQDGGTIAWTEFIERYDEAGLRSQLSHHIQVSAWVSPLKLIGQSDRQALARMELMDGKYMHWSFTLGSQNSLSEKKTYLAVWLWLGEQRWIQREDHTGPNILVVAGGEGDDDTAAERVGFGGIWQSSCTFFDVNGTEKACVTGPALSTFAGDPVRENWTDEVWLEGPGMFPKTRRRFRLG